MTLEKKANLLFFHTKTTGLPDFKMRASDPLQPHLVEFAAVFTDGCGTVLRKVDDIIKPDGWEIPKSVSDIYGVTQEAAMTKGVDEPFVAANMMGLIEESNLLVSHGVTFHKYACRIAARRYDLLGDDRTEWWKAIPQFCTMMETTDLCNIPGKVVGGRPKWPKLQETYQHIFHKPFVGSPDAMAEVMAIKDIFFFLNKPAIS